MAKQDIKDKLDELKIDYKSDATVAELTALLPKDDKEEKKVEEPNIEGSISGYKVVSSRYTTVKGKQYIEVTLSNATKTILSEEDLEDQLK